MGNYLQIFNLFSNNNNNNYNSQNLNIVKVKKIFKSYNILDTNKNIIIGIWDNPNKSNPLGNQGIWIGDQDKILELIFGITCPGLVVLNFESNITLKIIKKNSEDFLLELKNKDNLNYYSNLINKKLLNKLKKINNNSIDLDLIFNIIEC